MPSSKPATPKPRIVFSIPPSLRPLASSLRPRGATTGAACATPPTAPLPRRTGRLSRALIAMAAGAVAVAAAAAALHISRGARAPSLTPIRTAATPTLKSSADGSHVRWHSDSINLVLDDSLAAIAQAAPAAVASAIDSWRTSGAPLPSVSTIPGTGRRAGYSPGGANENVVMFAPDGYGDAHGALAITVLTYETDSGALIDADIVINGGSRHFGVLDGAAQLPSEEGDSNEGEQEGEQDAEEPRYGHGGQPKVYDIQSLLTHELGHFFGLGEDYDDAKATMFARSRPGETHKRTLAVGDSNAIERLYAENVAAPAPAGCGGATIARRPRLSSHPAPRWLAVALAGAGLAMLARRRESRRGAMAGAILGIAAVLAPIAPPPESAHATPAAPRGDADAQVVGTASRWVDGFVRTDLSLRITACRASGCPDADQRVEVLGGRMGGVTQVVASAPVPDLGAIVPIRLRPNLTSIELLAPRFVR